ncbi:MAG TPA: hypothetical protein VG166_08720 [Caulobacteraceae bacterium]|jgi:hypothetical protein|nr:hypothetical protein [Caulobacteraceae bacterium]
MIVIGNPEKVSILVASLVSSRQIMAATAARAQTASLATLALMLAAAAWLVLGGAILANDQTAIISSGALAAWAALRFTLFADLHSDFAAEGRTATRLEDLLGLYAPGRFGPESGAVLAAPARKDVSPRMRSAPRLIDIGLIILIVAVISRSDWVRAWVAHGLGLVGL